MTLYRQLIIFTLVLFFILFTGTWFAKLETTRSFLVDQLESHAQDTATSLGLSISQHVLADDMPMVETMINAVFDRGYYRRILLRDLKQNVLIERVLAVDVEKVPAWFIRWIPLEIPEVEANIMAGWRQVGVVQVQSHPGYAYKTLWEDVVRTTFWFFACGIFVMIAGGLGLRVLLRPLALVERQADALFRKEYEIQEKIPWTREHRRVVEAMNRMTIKVKEMFEEQAALAEGFRERTYHDPLTGLGNRRYFETQITARLDCRDSTTRGIVLLIQIQDLEALNRQRGFQAGDELIKRVAALIQESAPPFVNAVLARLTGGHFGIFLPDTQPCDAEEIASGLANRLGRLAAEQLTLTDNVGHVGASTYEGATTIARLLSEADLALHAANQTGPNTWSVRAVTEEMEKMPLGQNQWKETLEKALQERRISLDAQPVVKAADRSRVLHLEILSRIIMEDGKILSAGVFIPLAEHLKLVSTLDRLVLEQVMRLDRSRIGVDRVAVNVSPTSLRDDAFQAWLKDALKGLAPSAPRIIFEFSEFGAVQNLNLVKDISAMIHRFGHATALDHYGQSFTKLGYLKSLKPEYVKIDRAYTGELKDEESDSRFFIGSLCSVAHSIDIKVIAEGVETEQQAQILKELNLDGIQGYVVEKPKPIKDIIRKA
jgi:diguanylate cyclase (GGDEF)-like protein